MKPLTRWIALATLAASTAAHGSILVNTETAAIRLAFTGAAWETSIQVGAAVPEAVDDVTFEMTDPEFREYNGITYRVTPAPGTTITTAGEPSLVFQTNGLAGLSTALLTLNTSTSTFTPVNTLDTAPLNGSPNYFLLFRDLAPPATSLFAMDTSVPDVAYTLTPNTDLSFNMGFAEWGTYDLVFNLIGITTGGALAFDTFEFAVVVPEPATAGVVIGVLALAAVVSVRRRR